MKDMPDPAVMDAFSTRYSLLTRLQDWDDQEGWKDFFETYWRLIYSLAIKAGLTETEAQDVIQETVISVAKSIHKFKLDGSLGSFKAWLRNIIRWRITDQFQKRMPLYEDDGKTLAGMADDKAATLDAAWDREWQDNLAEVALERIKQRVKEEHYQMFHLYVLKRMKVSEVAEMFNVSSSQVYVNKHRISAMIKKEVKRLEKKPL